MFPLGYTFVSCIVFVTGNLEDVGIYTGCSGWLLFVCRFHPWYRGICIASLLYLVLAVVYLEFSTSHTIMI
jgi:hypothetical protein